MQIGEFEREVIVEPLKVPAEPKPPAPRPLDPVREPLPVG